MDAEEVLLRGRGHGERVPLQLRDGRAVEEDVLTHLHFETALHQLQLQHLGRAHHNLKVKTLESRRCTNNLQNNSGAKIIFQTCLPVADCLHVTNETNQTFTEIQKHWTYHPHPGLKENKDVIK